MLNRTRLLLLFIPAFLLAGALRADDLDGSPAGVGAAEAARLYSRANDFVTRIHEGDYSYAYMQFYWKRAEANVERAERVYAGSPTARELKSGDLKLGPYTLDYFRDRVLYNLEQKRLGALDQVNCPIYLYGLDPKRADERRDAALVSILETLARQQRWSEALIFPVLDRHRPLLLGTIFRVAARYDQKDVITRLTAAIPAAIQQAAGFWTSQAEALALLGKPRGDLALFLRRHPQEEVKKAALLGIVRREVILRRMQALHIPMGLTVPLTHFQLANLNVRDDVEATAARLFAGHPEASAPALAVYRAALGERPAAGAPDEAHLAYLRFLADDGKLGEVAAYPGRPDLGSRSRLACQLGAIEFLAEAGKGLDGERPPALQVSGPLEADQAALAEFRGRLNCTEPPFIAREKTFSTLPINDPCVLAVAIGEWAMSPNQHIRGAPPWDSVVYRFTGGFDHLPMPASKAVSTAASTLLPY